MKITFGKSIFFQKDRNPSGIMKTIYQLRPGVGNIGSGLIAALLRHPRRGVMIGNDILLDIIPESRKRADLTAFIQAYHDFLYYQQHPCYSDANDVRKIHLHVNKCGKIAYFAVPASWMESK